MDATRYVKITDLREHELQAELSPWMSEKKWAGFLDSVAHDGILQPVIALPDGRIVDGKHRLRAARELGLAGIRVIYEDIPEDRVAAYIENTKLERDDLTKGQRACIVLNSDEAQRIAKEARERQEQAGEYGKEGGRGKIKTLCPEMGKGFSGRHKDEHTSVRLAKKAGIGRANMEYLMAVKRKRPDLYQRVFNGYDESGKEVRIGTVYAEMKRAEAAAAGLPLETKRERLDQRAEEIEAQAIEYEESAVPPSDDLPASAPHNSIVRARKLVYDAATTVLSVYKRVEEVDDDARGDYFAQLDTLVEAALLTRSRYETDEENASILDLCIELIRKLRR